MKQRLESKRAGPRLYCFSSPFLIPSPAFFCQVSLPYVDKRTVKITWRNTQNECIIKVTATSIGGSASYNKDGRIYKCTDPQAEIPR